jgi:hypothetical protein
MGHRSAPLLTMLAGSLALAFVVGSVAAGPLENGEAALKRGDYSVAWRISLSPRERG